MTRRGGTNRGGATSSYAVGYGKPPTGNRFKPGTSGNPKGRPKKAKGAAQVLSDILDGQVAITDGGVARRISRREVIFKVLASKALAGDIRSIRLLLKTMQEFGLPIEEPQARSFSVRFVRPAGVAGSDTDS